MDTEAIKITQLTELNHNSGNLHLRHIRERIVQLCAVESPPRGEVLIDASFFGGRRIRGRRGRGAFKKMPGIGAAQAAGQGLYQDCLELFPRYVDRHSEGQGGAIYSDGWKGCSGLVDPGYKKHHRRIVATASS